MDKQTENTEQRTAEEKIEKAAEEVKETEAKAEDSAEEAKEAEEKAEEASGEAKEAAEEAKEAAQKVKEKVKEAPKPEPKKDVQVSKKLADIIKEIEDLSVLELSDLVKALEQKFGVSAAPITVGVAGPASGQTGGEEAAADEGQTTFNVILADGGANKISVIKAVRELVPTLGLKEAKDLVDSAPKPVLEGAGKDAANEAKQKLEGAGGKVELQ